MTNIFDSHAHYTDKKFDHDRDELLTALPDKGIAYVMNAASDIESSHKGIVLAERYNYIYASAGVHPHDTKDAPEDLCDKLRELSKHPKVKAIGEIGLDYHYDFSPRDVQISVFESQLRLSVDLDLPVIVHDREAHADTLHILKKYRPKGVVHCFSGSAEMAKELLSLGLYIGFTGVVTFKNARKTLEAVAQVPIDRLLIETDCPYMAPEPFRGKRCDSSMLERTADTIATVKAMDLQDVLNATCQNAKDIYGI